MLRGTQKAFLIRLDNMTREIIGCEEGETLQEQLANTMDNLKAGWSGNWGYLPEYKRPLVLSTASMMYFIQSVGGCYEYSEYKQIEALASLYCETGQEKQAYIEKWEKVLDKKGYEPILEHYAYIMYRGLERLIKQEGVSL